MKKIFSILTIMILAVGVVEAQQIIRQTLGSTGKVKVAAPFRVSWTAGSCPGCSVLHPNSPSSAGYLRQGFQQPPELSTSNNSAECLALGLTAKFDITPVVSPLCGTRFDLGFTGQSASGVTFSWDFGEGALPRTSTLINPTGVIYATAGVKVITLTIKKGNCNDSKARVITIAANQIGFAATTAITDTKCFGDKTGSIKLTVSGGTGNKTFKWSNNATTQDISSLAAGKYSVTATDASGCTFSVDTTVKGPTAAISHTDSLKSETCTTYKDGSIKITPSGGTSPYRFVWSNGSTTAKIDTLVAGVYHLTITDANGCVDTSTYEIKLGCRGTISTKDKPIYDIITPNGDNTNEKWIVDKIEEYPKNEVFIYNRWGQLVWNVKGYQNNWAGTNNDGQELPAAAYYYVIRLNDDKNTVWSGSITVVR